MKSSQLNNENQPTASASSPRDNPCLERDSTIAALEAIADDGISYLLPYAQFMYAEKISNPALEKEPDAPPEKMLIHFACADVVVLGSGLKRLEAGDSEIRIEICEVGGSAVGRHIENPHCRRHRHFNQGKCMTTDSPFKLQSLLEYPATMTKERWPRRWASRHITFRHCHGRVCLSRSAIQTVIASNIIPVTSSPVTLPMQNWLEKAMAAISPALAH